MFPFFTLRNRKNQIDYWIRKQERNYEANPNACYALCLSHSSILLAINPVLFNLWITSSVIKEQVIVGTAMQMCHLV